MDNYIFFSFSTHIVCVTKIPVSSYQVTFGVLFNDDRCANIFEALVGTLRAAKKRKIVAYDGELLLQGVHDNVEIILQPSLPTEAVGTAAVLKTWGFINASAIFSRRPSNNLY